MTSRLGWSSTPLWARCLLVHPSFTDSNTTMRGPRTSPIPIATTVATWSFFYGETRAGHLYPESCSNGTTRSRGGPTPPARRTGVRIGVRPESFKLLAVHQAAGNEVVTPLHICQEISVSKYVEVGDVRAASAIASPKLGICHWFQRHESI